MMTQDEKVEALATWMGYRFKRVLSEAWYIFKEKDSVAVDKHRNWNPFASLDDAWMLVMKMLDYHNRVALGECGIAIDWRAWGYFWQNINARSMTTTKYAAAICEAIGQAAGLWKDGE